MDFQEVQYRYAQNMIPDDPLTFHPAPPTGHIFHLSSEMSKQLVDGFPGKFVLIFTFISRVKLLSAQLPAQVLLSHKRQLYSACLHIEIYV